MEYIAYLGNEGEFTSFSFGSRTIRFRTSPKLKKYTKIIEWDNGYLAVMAVYDINNMGETEEYIDLLPILENLYIDPKEFLADIKEVRIKV